MGVRALLLAPGSRVEPRGPSSSGVRGREEQGSGEGGRARGAGVGRRGGGGGGGGAGLGDGETNSIFCSSVAGGLPRPTGSQSEAISDRDECLFFPGAETKNPESPWFLFP